jgi:hypothetical protein
MFFPRFFTIPPLPEQGISDILLLRLSLLGFARNVAWASLLCEALRKAELAQAYHGHLVREKKMFYRAETTLRHLDRMSKPLKKRSGANWIRPDE